MSSQSSMLKLSDSQGSTKKVIRRLKSSSHLRSSLINSSLLSSSRLIRQPIQKPIITLLIYDSLKSNTKTQYLLSNCIRQFLQIFGDKIKIMGFGEYKELLKNKYECQHLYYILISQQLLENCQEFVENERQMNKNKIGLWLFCLQSHQSYSQNKKIYGKVKSSQRVVFRFNQEDSGYVNQMIEIVRQHAMGLSVEDGSSVKRWAMTNSSSKSKPQNPKMHFICEEIIYEMIASYISKRKDNAIKLNSFKTFDQVLTLLKIQRVSHKRDVLNSSYYSSMKDIASNESSYYQLGNMSNQNSQTCSNKSFKLKLTSELKKVENSQLKIIVCRKYNEEIKKFRALVNNQRGKWMLWEISDESADIISRLKAYFGQEEDKISFKELQYFSNQPEIQVKSQTFEEELKMNKIQLNIEPARCSINRADKTMHNIHRFKSRHLSQSIAQFIFFDPFQPFRLPQQQIEEYFHIAPQFEPIQFISSTFDTNIPSLKKEFSIKMDSYSPQMLNETFLMKIKQSVSKHEAIQLQLDDNPPYFNQQSVEADNFSNFTPFSLPPKMPQPICEIDFETAKVLFFDNDQKDYIKDEALFEYKMVKYSSWSQLLQNLVGPFSSRQTYKLKSQNGNLSVVELQPTVYLEKHLHMKDFKYFSEESHSWLPFWNMSQVYYQSQLSLTSKLHLDDSPGVVIYSQSNQKWISSLKLKFPSKFRWFSLEDQSWIDDEGNLKNETYTVKLIQKINLHLSMFSNSLLDISEGISFFRVNGDDQKWKIYQKYFKKSEKEIIKAEQESVINFYSQQKTTIVVVFVNNTLEKLQQIEKESLGRFKLIYLSTKFTQSSQKLFIKYSQINPVISSILKIEKTGRKEYIIYHKKEGKSLAQSIIFERGLSKVEEKEYSSVWPDLDKIFSSIKGLYRKIYMVCYQDEKKDIQKLFSNYKINYISDAPQIQFSLLMRDWSPTSSVRHKKQSPIQSLMNSQQVKVESPGSNQLAIESGQRTASKPSESPMSMRDSLPIESRDQEQAPGSSQRMLRIDDFSKIYIIYPHNMEMNHKRQLLAACTQNEKIVPVLYNSVSELKNLQGESSLILLMMKEIPMELFNQLIEKQQLSIVFKGNYLKAVLPKYTDINLRTISALFQFASASSIKKMESQQVSSYLSKFESQVISKGKDSQVCSKGDLQVCSKGSRQSDVKEDYGLMSNQSQKTNLTSVCIFQTRSNEQQLKKLIQSQNKNLLVLLVDFNKRNKYTIIAVKHHLILQSYSGDTNLQTEIRKKVGRHVIMMVISKELLPKAIAIKKKYDNVFIFLQYGKNNGEVQEGMRQFLVGEFSKSTELEKFLGNLGQPKIQSNPENNSSKSDLQTSNNKNSSLIKGGHQSSVGADRKGRIIETKKSGGHQMSEQKKPSHPVNMVKTKAKSPVFRGVSKFSSEYYQ